MKLAIFGATGSTGRHLVEQALQAGHQVRALVRTSGILAAHPALETITGTLAQADLVGATVLGADAVISVIGARKGEATPICTDAMRAIVPAMGTARTRRLVALSAYGASETRHASWFIRFVRMVIAAKMRDKDGMEAVVRASALDWTLVRPPMLTDGPRSGAWRAGTALVPGMGARLSRADLAAFLLQEALAGEYMGQAVVVSQ
ncbi:MAG TPA: NAD(P)H-binding protein [Telluria sp.]|jgi:putative NADH-flavin reductase